VIFRIPTPTFGLGLVEQLPDSAINANARADVTAKSGLGRRTRDLVQAILAHQSPASFRFQASEANRTVDRYKGLGETEKQDLLNFLRSL
jgi:CxxC motif-containing protein (DUF1111 family)